jgi:hypothetical protein
MNHIITSSSLQTFENGNFKKHVEEQEIINGKRVNYINYDVRNDKNNIITQGKKNNKRFSYKTKIKRGPVSFPVIWGMPISSSTKKRLKSKKKRNGSSSSRNKRKSYKK